MSDTNPSPDRRAVEKHAVRVPDDAMAPKLRRGDVAVYDTRFPQAGQIAVAQLRSNGRVVVREFRPAKPTGFELAALNPHYRVIRSLEGAVEIFGRVVTRMERVR